MRLYVKKKREKVGNVSKKIGFEGVFAVDCQGKGGGLAMCWRNKKEITLQSYSSNHIDVVVNIQGWSPFRLNVLYEEPNRAKRRATWDLIRQLHSQSQLPWVLIGDMNNILG